MVATVESELAQGAISDEARSRMRGSLDRAGATQRQMAQDLGVTEASVSRWLRQKVPIPLRAVEWISEKTGQSIDWLLGRERAVPGENITGTVSIETKLRSEWDELPVFDGIQAAGILTGAEQWPEPIMSAEPRSLQDEIGPNGIGLIVRGNSMAGGVNTPIPHGSIVWINPHVFTQERCVVAAAVRREEDGDAVAVVKYHDGDNTLYSLPAPSGSARVPYPVAEVLAMCEVIAVQPQPGRP